MYWEVGYPGELGCRRYSIWGRVYRWEVVVSGGRVDTVHPAIVEATLAVVIHPSGMLT